MMDRVLQAFTVVGVVRLVSRGTDWLADSQNPKLLLSDYGSTTVAVWGASCLFAAAFIVAGWVLKSEKVFIPACLTGFAVYFMLGVSVIPQTFGEFPPDGWRIMVDHWCAAAAWLVIASQVAFKLSVYQLVLKKVGGEHGMARSG